MARSPSAADRRPNARARRAQRSRRPSRSRCCCVGSERERPPHKLRWVRRSAHRTQSAILVGSGRQPASHPRPPTRLAVPAAPPSPRRRGHRMTPRRSSRPRPPSIRPRPHPPSPMGAVPARPQSTPTAPARPARAGEWLHAWASSSSSVPWPPGCWRSDISARSGPPPPPRRHRPLRHIGRPTSVARGRHSSPTVSRSRPRPWTSTPRAPPPERSREPSRRRSVSRS